MIVLVLPASMVFGLEMVQDHPGGMVQVRILARPDDLQPFEAAAAFPPKAREWFRTPDGAVLVGCPTCRSAVRLRPDVHTVEQDGCVTPSFVCPCGRFHAWIRLCAEAEPGARVR